MAWPAIVESFFIAFAGLVDSLMVSSLGSYAVAAVGLTTQPKLLGLAFFFALNVSISALVARRRGEQRQGAANETLVTALVFIILAAAAFSVGFVAFASPIIHLCGSTAETHNGAVTYFRIIMGGMIFNCIQMGINSAQRGAGNTKITMRTNVTSNTINIILNYLLINGHFGFPALGIQGAALATVTGTVVGCVMSILSITKQDGFLNLGYILKNKIKPTIAAFISLVRVGYSVFFEQVFMRIGFMMTAIMAAKQGTDAMAAHQVGMNIMSLSFAFGDGLQSAAVALIGRNTRQKTRIFFVLMFMLRGIPFVDLAYLHKRDLQGNTLSYRRRKTGRALTVSLTPEAMQMVRMIANKDKDSPYLFPILQSEEGTEAAYREYQSALRAFNQRLAVLRQCLGMQSALSSYAARHTWATMAYHCEIHPGIISEAMGHSSITVTETYLKPFSNRKIDEANQRVISFVKNEGYPV